MNAFLVGYVPIIISIVGFGMIAYKVIDEVRHRKGGKVDIKELAKDVKQQDRDELDQLDRQGSERNEGDDRSTPANLK
jgi:hypothetical protein